MPRTRRPSLYETALAYLAVGRSVAPIAPGCKAPSLVDPRTGRRMLIRWERYQATRASPDEVRRWFSGPQLMGLGIVAGPVSGITRADGTRAGLEILDFDDPAIHVRFLAPVAACGASSLLEGLVCEETPGGGRHYGYCCVEWGASTILARRQVGMTPDGRDQMWTLIETRGAGGQCGGAHPTGDSPRRPRARVCAGARGLDPGVADHAQGAARAVGLCPGAG